MIEKIGDLGRALREVASGHDLRLVLEPCHVVGWDLFHNLNFFPKIKRLFRALKLKELVERVKAFRVTQVFPTRNLSHEEPCERPCT